jgi:SPX domain protein involved in polyphosphate accumulation
MKFARKFAMEMVPEWKAKYMNYKDLKKQIKTVKDHAVALAKAYSEIAGESCKFHQYNSLVITGEKVDMKVELKNLKDVQVFYEMLDANITLVKDFYQQQLEFMKQQFEALTSEAIALVQAFRR